MNTKTFRNSVFAHMKEYKEEKFKLKNKELYRNTLYDHILPKGEEKLNIIDESVREDLKNMHFHPLFAHMSSSQAMAINLFYPLVKSKQLNLLDSLLGCNIDQDASAQFEHKGFDDSEYDFFIDNDSEKIIFEVKYTERSIHSKPKGHNIEDRWIHLYQKPMSEILINPIEGEALINTQYQLWRNIINVAFGNIVAFVFPKERDNLTKEVLSAIKLVKDQYKTKIKILYTQDIYNEVKKINPTYYLEFAKKYFIQNQKQGPNIK